MLKIPVLANTDRGIVAFSKDRHIHPNFVGKGKFPKTHIHFEEFGVSHIILH